MMLLVLMAFNIAFSVACVVGLNRRAAAAAAQRVIFGHSGAKAKRLSAEMEESYRRMSRATLEDEVVRAHTSMSTCCPLVIPPLTLSEHV